MPCSKTYNYRCGTRHSTFLFTVRLSSTQYRLKRVVHFRVCRIEPYAAIFIPHRKIESMRPTLRFLHVRTINCDSAASRDHPFRGLSAYGGRHVRSSSHQYLVMV